VPARCAAISLFGPVSIPVGSRCSRGLPVLVHVVSQRARVLRLRRAGCPLAIFTQSAVLPSPVRIGSAPLINAFRSSIARPTDALVYASTETSRSPPQDSGSGWSRFLLSRRDSSSPATCRFIPAHPRMAFERWTFWLTAKVLDYCHSLSHGSEEPSTRFKANAWVFSPSRKLRKICAVPPRASRRQRQDGSLLEHLFSAPRSQGNCAPRTAMAAAVASLGARGSGTVGRAGKRARRIRWLQP
jgi:hypothetical protein